MAPYLPLLEEELAYRGEDRRAPGWQLDKLAPGVDFRVLIIGAGMSACSPRTGCSRRACRS